MLDVALPIINKMVSTCVPETMYVNPVTNACFGGSTLEKLSDVRIVEALTAMRVEIIFTAISLAGPWADVLLKHLAWKTNDTTLAAFASSYDESRPIPVDITRQEIESLITPKLPEQTDGD
jgi:hypothetical protein